MRIVKDPCFIDIGSNPFPRAIRRRAQNLKNHREKKFTEKDFVFL